jgi:hypothetical protein
MRGFLGVIETIHVVERRNSGSDSSLPSFGYSDERTSRASPEALLVHDRHDESRLPQAVALSTARPRFASYASRAHPARFRL